MDPGWRPHRSAISGIYPGKPNALAISSSETHKPCNRTNRPFHESSMSPFPKRFSAPP